MSFAFCASRRGGRPASDQHLCAARWPPGQIRHQRPAGVGVGLLSEHVNHCVRKAAQDDPAGADDMIDEVTRAIERLVRS